MKILSLTLENFRSIKNLTVNFDGKDADVLGDRQRDLLAAHRSPRNG